MPRKSQLAERFDDVQSQPKQESDEIAAETESKLPSYVIVDETRVIDVHGNTLKFRRDERVTDPHRIRLVLDHNIKIRYDVCPKCGHHLTG